MDDILNKLEMRVNALTYQCKQLISANNNLKRAKSLLVEEKEVLAAKNKAAVAQIEEMVSQLKLLEGAQ